MSPKLNSFAVEEIQNSGASHRLSAHEPELFVVQSRHGSQGRIYSLNHSTTSEGVVTIEGRLTISF